MASYADVPPSTLAPPHAYTGTPIETPIDPISKEHEETLAAQDLEASGHSARYAQEKAHRVVHVNAEAASADKDVFAARTEGGPDYRGVGFMGALALLLKSQIGLGVLSLPQVMNVLGIVPGLLLLVFLGVLSTYGDYIFGQFRNNFPGVHSVGDIGYIMAGTWGRELLGWSYWLFQIFITASGMLAFSIALNAVTTHATCTVAFTVVAAVIIGSGASLRTFKAISWLGWVGVCCIIPAILICTIAVGVADRPGNAPATGPFDKQLKAFNNPTFAEAMVAVVNVLFAYGGSPGFVSIIAEMKNPRDYTKVMLVAQGFSIALYLVVSIVLWNYAGIYVASPALGTAGPLIKKIGYGIAMPGLLAGPIISTHLAVKYVFVKFLRNTRHLQESTPTHWAVWISLVLSMTTFAFIIAQVIPFFDQLIGLVGAIFCSLFCLGLQGVMWIYTNNYKRQNGPTSVSYKLLYANALMMIVVAAFILVAGFYASVVEIRALFNDGGISRPFSCSDNSNSV